MADINEDQQIKLARVMESTGAPADVALQMLEASNWDPETAAGQYFADVASDSEIPADSSAAASSSAPALSGGYTGPRTLDGTPVPASQSRAATSSSKPPRRTGVATLSSVGRDDNDDDDDSEGEDERRKRRNLFAGGEKSGLAVQDPARGGGDHRDETNRLLDGIRRQAMAQGRRMNEEAARAPPPPRFTGNSYTLGGDGVESRMHVDPNTQATSTAASTAATAASAGHQEIVKREIHLWRDGFSIGAGPLYSFADPANQAILRMINNGQAPLEVLNISAGQPVDVAIISHNENWRQLPRPRVAFEGEGQRLGAPVPGASSTAATEHTSTTDFTPTSSTPAVAVTSSQLPTPHDESQPSVAVRVQLPNGSRLPARFNLSQTVGDIYSFASQADPTLTTRAFVISTTFPNKDHTDKAAVLGDMVEFKKGGVAIVKWA
ncbi:UBX domain-containing protein 3 [Ceratocystis fimbriata CBS 114723]|uniref:UBX domain-containing protein 3 n=1 Tax=Ceratocystis fimbriata CBS 114723 TaxID=1035309 RepID=A0A2C5WXA5_9PEZI|nr:UBX domain-containing protein 3 [Ceratocystis fimbriata CBS 114723]